MDNQILKVVKENNEFSDSRISAIGKAIEYIACSSSMHDDAEGKQKCIDILSDLYDIKDYTNEKMRIYSMSDGGTISTTRNKNMIGNCDIYIPSTCFGKENMKCYVNFSSAEQCHNGV